MEACREPGFPCFFMGDMLVFRVIFYAPRHAELDTCAAHVAYTASLLTL